MVRKLGASVATFVLLVAACTSSPAPSTGPGLQGASPAPTAFGSGAAATTVPVSPAGTLDRASGWRSDIAALVPGMDRLHPDLGHDTPVTELQAAADALSATIPAASDDELMAGVLRIVALVSAKGCDAHTGAFVWGTGSYPVESLPLRLWEFPSERADSTVIVDALAPYQALVGSTIDSIEGRDTLEVLKALEAVIPRDNDSTIRLLTPRYLLIPQVLRGLGLADTGPISLGLTDPSGAKRTMEIKPIPMADYNAWAGPYGLHLPVDPDVRYLSRIDDALWWERLPDDETLYVQYNRVDRLPSSTIADLKAALHAEGVERVVLDARHNYGGEVSALDPLIALFEDPAVDQPERLFLITGRNTFSAGSLLVARLDRDTDAVIVGEPMGGCPTLYGDSEDFTLPWSGITVSVATELTVGVDPNDPRQTIKPDVAAELTPEEWATGRDPALEAIVAIGP